MSDEEIVLGRECHDWIFLDHQPTTPDDPHLSFPARKEKCRRNKLRRGPSVIGHFETLDPSLADRVEAVVGAEGGYK